MRCRVALLVFASVALFAAGDEAPAQPDEVAAPPAEVDADEPMAEAAEPAAIEDAPEPEPMVEAVVEEDGPTGAETVVEAAADEKSLIERRKKIRFGSIVAGAGVGIGAAGWVGRGLLRG